MSDRILLGEDSIPEAGNAILHSACQRAISSVLKHFGK